uniref:Non-ribosomal peptide synthetase module-related protein n=1 Tax=Fischerella sp. MV11 TaxID=397321 RepID=E1U3N1_9CYAN|nr:non-ribosomal peptide synthetase module-related protein [Fischerella sp. MV11]
MDLHSLLSNLFNKNVKLSVDGDSLNVDAPKGAITSELRDSLAEHKAELLLLLQENSVSANYFSLPTITPAPDQKYQPFPLTDMQYAYWIGRSGELELGNVANHGYYEIECLSLDLEKFNWALQKLIARHDMLRVIVLPDGQQQILEQVPPYHIEILDLRGENKEVVASKIEAIRQHLSHQVLAVDQWPLFEFRATHLDGDRVRLHISYDLQVFDAWSLFRLFDEWFQLYQNPQIELPPLELSFRDYVLVEQALQKTELYQRSQDYWFNRLNTLPPVPDLPLAKNPSQLKQPWCQRYDGRLDQIDWQQLQQRAAQAGLTASGILLAAFAEVLTLWSQSPRFTINLALFNRLPLHPQVNDILGDFTSINLLAVDNSIPASFTDRAVCIQKQLWKDLEHRYFSGVRVTRELALREGKLPTAMPIVFTSTLGFGKLGQQTSTFSHFGELVYGISQASQVWMDVQVWEEKGALTFNWDVVEELFPEGLIQDMFAAYCRFLKQLATSDFAWVENNRQLLPPEQLTQQTTINATAAPVSDQMLHTLFAKQVSIRKHEPAVISSQRTLTYQQLYELSNQIGHRLRQLGACPNQLVAVVMEKGWEQIVAVLGILNSGAAYLPIDSNIPKQRLWYLLENGEIQIVLTQSELHQTLDWPESIQKICVDTEELTHEKNQPLTPVQRPEDLAYVIYTSGSTGLPKGVMIDHRGAVNTITDINQRFGIGCHDRVLALSALSFDLSVYDIFGILAVGGTIVIPDASVQKDPEHWLELIDCEQVTIWNSAPALMEMLVEFAAAKQIFPSSLRLALLSGDWLRLTLPAQIQSLFPKVHLISLGGATEASIWSILYPIEKVDPTWTSIPYGRPMANQSFYVLNELLEPCPVWVPGQLYIGGVGLAQGYWRNEEKTHTSFITHPRTGDRLYCTGDLGRYLPDGNIEFLGRVDFQFKIRGYRIEAGEIEAVLTQHPAVRKAVVKAVGEEHNKERLLAYIVLDEKQVPKDWNFSEELRCFLSERLPSYMVPHTFMMLDALPLSVNGKVDRKALPEPEQLSSAVSQPIDAVIQSNITRQIVEIVQGVLKIDNFDFQANLLNLGATSVELVRIANQLEKKFQHRLKISELVYLTSVSDLIAYYEKYLVLSKQEQPKYEVAVTEDWEEGEI